MRWEKLNKKKEKTILEHKIQSPSLSDGKRIFYTFCFRQLALGYLHKQQHLKPLFWRCASECRTRYVDLGESSFFSHIETGSVARIVSNANMFGKICYWQLLRVEIAIFGFSVAVFDQWLFQTRNSIFKSVHVPHRRFLCFSYPSIRSFQFLLWAIVGISDERLAAWAN